MPFKDILGSILEKIALRSSRSPYKTLLAALIVTLMAGYIAKDLQLDPSIVSLIPQDRPPVQNYVEMEEEFKHTEFMVAVIRIPHGIPVNRYRLFLKEYQKGLETIPELETRRLAFDSRFVLKVRKYLNRHGTLLMDEAELKELNKRLAPELLAPRLALPNPYRDFLSTRVFDPLDVTPLFRQLFPLGDKITLDRSKNFFISEDPTTYFFLVGNDLPWEWQRTKKIIKEAKQKEKAAWDKIMPTVQKRSPKMDIGRADIHWVGKAMDILHMTEAIWETFTGTLMITTVLILILFLIFFRNPRSFLLAYLPILLGLIWSFAYARLTVGKLNMLSVICGALLIGLGVDFSAYLLNRFFQLRERDVEWEEALRITWRETGQPVCFGAFTTIVAFCLLIGSRLPAFRDIGFITSGGLLINLISVLVLLPALLKIFEKGKPSKSLWRYPRFLAELPLKRPLLTFLVCLMALGVLGGFISRFKFLNSYQEAYIMFRQPTELRSEPDQHLSRLLKLSLNPVRLFIEGKDWKELLQKNERLAEVLAGFLKQGKIAQIDSLKFFLPSLQKQERIAAILPHLNNLEPEKFYARYRDAAESILKDPERPRYSKAGFGIYGREIRDFLLGRETVDAQGFSEAGLDKLLRHYSTEKDGHLLLSTYVYLPLGDYPRLKEEFVTSLKGERAIQAMGVRFPSIEDCIREIRVILEKDLMWLGPVVLAAIMLILWAAFRSVKLTLVATAPMLLGGIAAVGAYILIRGNFSVFNILWVPIYLGLATDDALHIGKQLGTEGGSIYDALRNAGAMILLTSLTTMVAFGSFLFTDVELVKRISIWVLIAMACELLASLFLFPVLLKWVGGAKPLGRAKNNS